eukprot:15548660-Heterocapsa_arctica.AAC.1
MSNKSKNGVDTGGICEPSKIGERLKRNFQNYANGSTKGEGHMDPGCWYKPRNKNRRNCQTTYSGKQVDSPILGLPKVHQQQDDICSSIQHRKAQQDL